MKSKTAQNVECTNNCCVLPGSSLPLPSLPTVAAGEARPVTLSLKGSIGWLLVGCRLQGCVCL